MSFILDTTFSTSYLAVMKWFRGVLAGIVRWFELAARLGDLEDEVERLRAQVVEHQLEWISQVDKLAKLHRRAYKRDQDQVAALSEANLSVTDIRLQRAQRRAELRERRRGANESA